MNKYRDLGKEDVLQAGDVFHYLGEERNILTIWIGDKAKKHPHTFRRPLTPSEIVAAERVKYIEWASSRGYLKRFIVTKNGKTELRLDAEIGWRAWCAALSIDPMGDVE